MVSAARGCHTGRVPTGDATVLTRLLAAFNAHDLDAIMGFFAEDCVLETPRGEHPWGTRFEGRDAVRDGRLVAVRLDRPTYALLAVHAVLPPGRHPPAKVRALVDFLVRRFAPEPSWDRGLPDGDD